MNIITPIVVIILVGMFMWFIQRTLPLPAPFMALLNLVVTGLLGIWLLQYAGFIPTIVKFPQL